MSGDRYFIRDQNAPYFLTFTIVNWLYILESNTNKKIIVDSMNYCVKHKGLIIYSWVIMSNHIHVIWEAVEPNRISDIIRDFKKFTSKAIVKNLLKSKVEKDKLALYTFRDQARQLKRIWYDSNHAIHLAELDIKMKDQRLDYIHFNPVRAGIVEFPEEYQYSSARDYSGMKGLVDIEIL